MRIFLAGAFDHRDDIKVVRAALEEQGHEVTSTWLDEVPLAAVDAAYHEQMRRHFAQNDLYDVGRSDAVATFTCWPSTTGGRHTELGVAIDKGLRVYRIGPRDSVYSTLVDETFETVREFIEAMGDRAPQASAVVDPYQLLRPVGGWE